MPKLVPLFARQAIYDRELNVIAYELLFRHSDDNYAQFIDGDRASSEVLLNAFGDHKLSDITDNKKAFVNFTRNLILSPPLIPPKNLVIEILEDIKADGELIKAVEKLKEKGFGIALDDFFITKDTKRLLKYANIIKVDVLSLTQAKLEKYVSKLKPLNFLLLAEKIENHEMMEFCKSLGFDYFQGYFLCKPQIIKGHKVEEAKEATIRLLSALNNKDVDFNSIVDTIASDPALSYKILRLVNSSAMAITVEIESLNQAVSMLGITAIKNWASFLLLANTGNKPKELSIISMCRAKFCELLGMKINGKQFADSCFTVGLLSNLDAFLDLPMSELLLKLNLAPEIHLAIEKFEGDAGVIFDLVQKYERGDWDKIIWSDLVHYGIDAESTNLMYSNAILWASEVSYG